MFYEFFGATIIPNQIDPEYDWSYFPCADRNLRLPKSISIAYLPVGALSAHLIVKIVELEVPSCKVS
jgi:hypothetical protein